MRKTSHILFGACMIGALALTGCSGSEDKGKDSSEENYGPLGDYLMAMDMGQELTQEDYDQQDIKREELIAECMAKEGFEYKPDTNNGGTVVNSDDYDGPEWGSLEFAQQYGYGFFNSPWQENAGEPQEYVDPNQDYIDGLSESEQQAYYETLHGPQPTEEEMKAMEENPEEGGYEYDWSKAGCYGAAQHEVDTETGGNPWEDPEFKDLFDAMNAFYMEAELDPEIQALDKEWASCMADAGYPDVTSKNRAFEVMMDEQNELYSGGEDGEYVEPDQKKLDEVKKKEIDMAVADWKCGDAMDYQDKYEKIDFRNQQKFLDDHKDQLDALIAAYGKKK
ncbi:MAG: hypothetical protein QM705_14070 [Ancrocorticia sp.]